MYALFCVTAGDMFLHARFLQRDNITLDILLKTKTYSEQVVHGRVGGLQNGDF